MVSKAADIIDLYQGRVTEEFILQQIDYHVTSDTWTDIKTRTEDSDHLYAGELKELFPTETALPSTMLVENKFKNALHDSSRLASEGRGMPKAMARGDKDKDLVAAQVTEAALQTYWLVNRCRTLERPWYMDLSGGGMMASAIYYDETSDYPQVTRLNPRFCYPTVRNNKLYDMMKIEVIKERVLAQMFPDEDLDPKGPDDMQLVCYYGPDEVTEAIVRPKKESRPAFAKIFQRWQHNLGVVPVGFSMIDTYDGSIRGIFDQLQGPMIVRNKIMRFMVDYLESIAHSPIVAKNVENPDELPGPLTVYRLDPDAESASMTRLAPAAPAGSVWGMLNYTDQQETREAIQPSSRVGSVSQSIASGSFVYSTQGALTSFVGEMQAKMSDMREQIGRICMMVDEKFMDFEKPLLHSVGKKRTYKPSADFDGWYYHTIEFGATAGLDRVNGDTRVLNHLSARLIDRGTARDQIDYLDDSVSIQEKIDRENVADALLQRFATDPATPVSSLANIWLKMGSGGSLVEAMEEVVPELVAAEQAAQPQTGGPVAPEPGAPTEAPPGAAAPPVVLPKAPLQSVFVNNGR